jgi:TFIIH basal transcription factor complex TTD-A subunit
VLVECDPSIKSIIGNLDAKNGNEYIIEDLDDGHVLITEVRLAQLKRQLDDVLRETQQPETESGSSGSEGA